MISSDERRDPTMIAPREIAYPTGSPIESPPCQHAAGGAERRERLHEAAHHPAIQRMIDEHARLVYRVAYSALRNWADAEDVVQETFLQLLRAKPERLREGEIGDEPAYLARIAWRLAVRRKQRPAPDDHSQEILEREPSMDRSPEQDVADMNFEAWLHGQIDSLPDKLRQPLSLAALGEFTSPQIAEVLGIPEGSVRRRIHSARRILKKQMERRQR